jgi:hypothetical protein
MREVFMSKDVAVIEAKKELKELMARCLNY